MYPPFSILHSHSYPRYTNNLSQGRYNVDKQQNKPNPVGRPHVWALGRQALNDTVPYHRQYQKGSYTNGGILYGLLIAAEVGVRDKFGHTVIITTM